MDFINITSIDELIKKAEDGGIQKFDEPWIDTGTGFGGKSFKDKKTLLGDQASDSLSDEEAQMGLDPSLHSTNIVDA